MQAAWQCPGHNLLQTWGYGESRATGSWQTERLALEHDGEIVGVVQALRRQLPWMGGGLVWVNRGPLLTDATEDRMKSALNALRRYWVEERQYYLRLMPAIPAEAVESTLEGLGGYQPAKGTGWASARVDITVDEPTLRKGLAQKWRNGLNKGERLGVEVEAVRDKDGFDAFIADYRIMLKEKGFVTGVTPAFLDRLYRHQIPGDGEVIAFRAHDGDEALGWALIVRYGMTAEYLVGVSRDAGRTVSAGQVLLWRALCAMKADGCRFFDVGGMDRENTPAGIYQFKEGLGGRPYRLAQPLEAVAGLRSRLVGSLVRRVGR